MLFNHFKFLQEFSGKKGFAVKLVAIAVLILLIGLLVWQLPAITSFFEEVIGGDTEDEYSTLSLVPGVSATYSHAGDSFVFSYRMTPTDESGLFYVAKNVEQTRSFPAVAGAKYTALGLEMRVSSVTPNLLVLLVKPI
jgi:hypothetical protein